MSKEKETILFRICRKLHIVSASSGLKKYSLYGLVKHGFITLFKLILYKYCYSSFLFEPLNFNKLRSVFWKWMGVEIGDNVKIGHSVVLDYGNTNLIRIGNNVIITDCCILLCHRRNITNYHEGEDSALLPYIYAPIQLEDGVNLGKGCIVMPGVTIGQGSIIGAGAVVTKSISKWCVAVGNPAKVIRNL